MKRKPKCVVCQNENLTPEPVCGSCFDSCWKTHPMWYGTYRIIKWAAKRARLFERQRVKRTRRSKT